MTTPIKPEAAVELPGLPGTWQLQDVKYDYAKAKSFCPVCGSVGWPWQGWFSCDGGVDLLHVALIETGEVFVKTSTKDRHANT